MQYSRCCGYLWAARGSAGVLHAALNTCKDTPEKPRPNCCTICGTARWITLNPNPAGWITLNPKP
eukprot:365535-Chlamydomonas_euryale.AAC.86